ncbi:TetR/AcrR family transcriptional regulator [Desulfosporosinus youngiae]|uniref:Transcriptional regulator n=1 Tax=Desulfosporosinus youngiae DSM 17734 TaxID=768710 RepID=H5Y4Q5_9FIRM|nr:TetR/AcrR family transcriptional regulator [Desulfosporosinus youngiae]EHQ89791.1 transcriptional regulator [Desulfosporosinus youngiae DSM 17734]
MKKTADLILNQSQQWFIDALLTLMKTKPFHKIQIKELAEKAGLDRRTFYRHFKSKEDVLFLQCRVVIEDFAKKVLAKNELNFKTVAISYFEFWNDYLDFLKLLKASNMICFFSDKMDKLYYEHVTSKVKQYLNGVELDHKTRYHFFYGMGGLWHVMNWWQLEDPRETPEEMGQILVEYITEIYASLALNTAAGNSVRQAASPS